MAGLPAAAALLGLGLLVRAQISPLPGQVPSWPVSFSMNASTFVMLCSREGFLNASQTGGFSIVDVDWSNARSLWTRAQPMNCEELLLQQASKSSRPPPLRASTFIEIRSKCYPGFPLCAKSSLMRRMRLGSCPLAALERPQRRSGCGSWGQPRPAGRHATCQSATTTTAPRAAQTCTTTRSKRPASPAGALASARRQGATAAACHV
jgi:hypothetical protein